MPDGLLRDDRDGAVGRPDHQQDAPQFDRPPGHDQSRAQLRSRLRDGAGRLPQLHARRQHGPAHVSAQVSL